MSSKKDHDWMKDLRLAARRKGTMLSLAEEPQSTQSSLLRQIRSLSNAPGWARFFETYAPLIERFALKSGLSAVESQEVVQSTMIQVSKTIPDFDRAKGSFKAWLYRCAKWRILDTLRARIKNTMGFHRDKEGLPEVGGESWEPGVSVFEKLWDEEWEDQLKREALEEVRKKVSGAHFQIFCLYVLEELPATTVAAMVGVRVAQVHLVKCRLTRMVRKALETLRKT